MTDQLVVTLARVASAIAVREDQAIHAAATLRLEEGAMPRELEPREGEVIVVVPERLRDSEAAIKSFALDHLPRGIRLDPGSVRLRHLPDGFRVAVAWREATQDR